MDEELQPFYLRSAHSAHLARLKVLTDAGHLRPSAGSSQREGPGFESLSWGFSVACPASRVPSGL